MFGVQKNELRKWISNSTRGTVLDPCQDEAHHAEVKAPNGPVYGIESDEEEGGQTGSPYIVNFCSKIAELRIVRG